MASPSANKSDDKVIAARKKNLDLAISQIQKDFGETAIMRLGDGHRVDVDVISTGNLLIDLLSEWVVSPVAVLSKSTGLSLLVKQRLHSR